MTPLLEIRDLNKSFGGLKALDSFSLCVNPGDVVGIVGGNGAGKSTLFHLITGYLTPDSGDALFEQTPLIPLSPEQRVMLGIARTFQKTRLFFGLSVAHNIRTGCFLSHRGGLRRMLLGTSHQEELALSDQVDDIIDLCGLESFRDTAAAALSYGYQRRLEVAVALGASPKLLLLDEPFSGQSPQSVDEMGLLIKKLQQRGISMMLIEHRMESIIADCNRLVVMDQGRLIIPHANKEVARVERG